jgi:hypothetical protein
MQASKLDQSPFDGIATAIHRRACVQRPAWLAATAAASIAVMHKIAAALCSEHVCEISGTSEDWVRVRSAGAAKHYAVTHCCPDCGQIFTLAAANTVGLDV